MLRISRHFPLVAAIMCAATITFPAASQNQTRVESRVDKDPKWIETKVSIVGKIVLPKESPEGMDLKALDLSKLTGSIKRTMPSPVKLPFAEGAEKMSSEEQRARLKQFTNSPEFWKWASENQAAILKWKKDQSEISSVPLSFNKDGSFKVDGLQPGLLRIEIRIPHEGDQSLSRATFTNNFTVTGEKEQVNLGELGLIPLIVLVPGDMAPDFTAQNYDGKEFKLSDYRGKYVLVDFWAKRCVPCVLELPTIKAVHQEFGGERFEVIGLNLDESIDDAKAFLVKNPSSYVHGYAVKHGQSQAVNLYGVEAIPSIWLIGPDGKIVARDLRGGDIREAVQKALKQKDDKVKTR